MKYKYTPGYLRLALTDLVGGTSFLKVLTMLQQHQYMNPIELNAIREDLYEAMLKRAKESTPYYRNITTYDLVKTLTKDAVQDNFHAFVSTGYNGKRFKKSTGGSTGIPLIYYTTPLVRSFLWAGIILSWQAAGYQYGEKVAFIAGTSILKKDLRHMLFYKLMNISVYSAFSLDDHSIKNYLTVLNRSRVKIIYAYASALMVMARYIQKTGPIIFPHLKSIVSTAEVLSDQCRNDIENAFNVKVYNQYGCNEAGVSAFECEYQKMHLISTRCFYEIDEHGELISSDMINEAFVMLRYHTGDIVELSDQESCKCGRTFPIIKNIIGRTFDIVRDKKGNVLHSAFFSILFRNDPSIKQFQIIVQNTKLEIHLKVDESLCDPMHYKHFITAIKKHLFFDQYILVLNDAFITSHNAKHRHIVCLN